MQDVGHPQDRSNGAEAVGLITAAAAKGKPFNLVLMDMQIPVMDGLEATRRLRDAGFDADDLPIVALTANAYADDIVASREARMQDHLSKPVTINTIRGVLSRFGPEKSSQTVDEMLTLPNHIAAEPKIDLAEMYQNRKAQTLAEAERLACQTVISDTEAEEFSNQVHQLAGTGGFFGDAALGSAAGLLEHQIKSVSFDQRPQIVSDGFKAMRNAQLSA